MNRYVFYFGVSLLAFLISITITLFSYFPINEKPQFSETTNQNFNQTVFNESEIYSTEKFKYGCESKELESFWEKLDKATFLKIRNYGYSVKDFEYLDEDFDCSIFKHIAEKIDLNGDNKKELIIRGIEVSNRADSEIFIFQKQNGLFKLILFDERKIEWKINKQKSFNFHDLTLDTNWAPDDREIRKYRFDGQFYKRQLCFAEKLVFFENPKTSEYKSKTVKTQIKCSEE